MRLFLALVLTFAVAIPARADMGLVVEEPISALGFFTRVGHAGIYLSNICPDGSPVKMRRCAAGEPGGVVSKYSPFSDNEDYDWAIMPFEEYMHGFGAPELAPLFGTPRLQQVIERYNFGPLFSTTLKTSSDGQQPDGQWKAALATRFDRTLYIFAVQTSPSDDAAIIAAFNDAPNRSRFNFFYRNCSDQAKGVFDLIWPEAKNGNRLSGLTMETPKGLAQALVNRAIAQPDLHLQVRRYAQIPGTYGRSRSLLFPLENVYKNSAFAPWWFFGGFREFSLGVMFYHQVLNPFSVPQSWKDFISPGATELTLEQHRLRRRQDEIRLAMTAAEAQDATRRRLAALHMRVYRRLDEIRAEKQAEANEVVGRSARWNELERQFESIVREVNWHEFAPEPLAGELARYTPQGGTSGRLFSHFDAYGEFFVDQVGHGPWMRLRLADGQMHASALSISQIEAGDQRVAALVLMAVLDDTLHAPSTHREDVGTVGRFFGAFMQATRALSRLDGAGSAERTNTLP